MAETLFGLMPMHDSAKSFYNKAKYYVDLSTGDARLISYTSHVAGVKDGKPYRVADVQMSNTTVRHIREFFMQRGLPKMTKAEIMKLKCGGDAE